MTTFAYVSPESRFLAARWLREQATPSGVCLLVDSDAAARVFAEQYPGIRVERIEAIDGDALDRVTLPVVLPEMPLHHRAPVTQPDLRPVYPAIRRLWQAGFRSFEFYSLHGSRVIEIPFLLDSLVDRHAGERCFVIGNGPSLNRIDMTRLRGEITFGANRGYMGSPDWGFDFSYWGLYDPLQIEEYCDEYERDAPRGVLKFFPLQYLPLLRLDQGCPVPMDWPRGGDREFSTDPGRLVVGYSVLYMLLQIAALMGCDPIYTVGLDHRYTLARRGPLTRMVRLAGRAIARRHEQTPMYRAARAAAWEIAKSRQGGGEQGRIWTAGDAQHPTHFTSRYTSERKRFLLPRPQDAARDYACAAAWARSHGRTLLNATPGTALETLPTTDYDAIFRGTGVSEDGLS